MEHSDAKVAEANKGICRHGFAVAQGNTPINVKSWLQVHIANVIGGFIAINLYGFYGQQSAVGRHAGGTAKAALPVHGQV